jgi:hypothetical protein
VQEDHQNTFEAVNRTPWMSRHLHCRGTEHQVTGTKLIFKQLTPCSQEDNINATFRSFLGYWVV